MDELRQEFDRALELWNRNQGKDRKDAVEILLYIQDDDDTFGEIYSSCRYYIGKYYDIKKEYHTAFKYYQAALKAVTPNIEVYTELGRMHYYNYIDQVDYEKAFEYFTKGKELGDTRSNYYLGCCHKYKKIENPSDKEAFECFAQYFEIHRTSLGAYELCLCYKKGIGTEIDLEKAYEISKSFPKKTFCLKQAGEIATTLELFSEATAHYNSILGIAEKNSADYNFAAKSISEIYNLKQPNAVLNAVKASGNNFEDIEKIINAHPTLNAEAVYDLAIAEETNGEINNAVKLFIISAAAGCKKAGYTLSNMAAEDTKYFTKIIEHGEN